MAENKMTVDSCQNIDELLEFIAKNKYVLIQQDKCVIYKPEIKNRLWAIVEDALGEEIPQHSSNSTDIKIITARNIQLREDKKALRQVFGVEDKKEE
jgi:predicted oxidoreductase (fatty acid repression mutant protein)